MCSVQLCITAAVASAMRGDQVMYIDTTGSFTSRRAAAIHNTLNSRLQVLRVIWMQKSITLLLHNQVLNHDRPSLQERHHS